MGRSRSSSSSRSSYKSRRSRKHSRRHTRDRLTRLEKSLEKLTDTVRQSVQGHAHRGRKRARSSSVSSEDSRRSYGGKRTGRSMSLDRHSLMSNVSETIPEVVTSITEDDKLASNATTSKDGNKTGDCLEIDVKESELHDLLGEIPDGKAKPGQTMNQALAERWNAIVRNGIPKEERERIQSHFKDPSNVDTAGPKLNQEIKKSVPPIVKDNDGELLSIQNHLAVGINGLGQLLTTLLDKPDEIDKKSVLANLSDVGRYLCGTQYAISMFRRKQIKRSIKNENMKEALGLSPLHPMLFGSDINTVIKTAETADKLGRNLEQRLTNPQISSGSAVKGGGRRMTRSTVPLNSYRPSVRSHQKTPRGGHQQYPQQRLLPKRRP